ncbi:MAG TPA: Rieske 2Fe-2S domain-containing protein [Solirubrobacteraceae bacterium]|nr:Rieske 2Fe-2S domain-containing protein [Solirubrobacteraceae bacterium]
MTRPLPSALGERIAAIEAFDAPGKAIAKRIRDVLPAGGGVKDVISGTWMGHALHPLLTDVPIGTWTSALLLDLFGGRASRPAAQKLVGVGLAAAAPTAWAGWSDWADSEPGNDEVRRVGIAHAIANGTAIALYGASFAARRRGAHATGVLFGLAGAGAMVTGGWIGGDLVFARGVGVNETLFDEDPIEWTPVLDASMLQDDRPVHAIAGDRPLVIVRRNGTLHALAARCAHRGGPLHEAELEGDCIVCPWHGTRFRLEDGSVMRGPSPYPQPVFEARVHEGRVEVRAAG